MIDVISESDLRTLAETREPYCVSIYLPTSRLGNEAAQGAIRLANALARALEELEIQGVRRREAEQLLAMAAGLENDLLFWDYTDLGLAIFADHEGTRVFRLPVTVEELVVISDRYHLTPLLPVVDEGDSFYVLVLSANQVRLFEGTRYGISELDLGDTPGSLDEASWIPNREVQLQSHSGGRTGTGDVSAILHGQGSGKESRNVEKDQFFLAVDSGVRAVIDDHNMPLVLAGVPDTVARYRRTSKYPHLVDASIQGNVELLGPPELHARAWPLVEALLSDGQLRARDEFFADRSRSVHTLPETLSAAEQGRVATLFVPLDIHRWGRLVSGRIVVEHEHRQPGDQDLFDDAAMATLLNGGEVFAVSLAEVPGEGPLAGVLRY